MATEAHGEPSARPTRKRRRWGRRFLLVLFGVGVLLGGFGAALVRSGAGQRFVLDALLDRTAGALAGSLTVDGVRSPSLLGGATLVGVTLEAEGGRRFFEADSVRLSYSILSLLGAPPRIASLTLFGPRVEISQYPGEEALNITRVAAPPADGADTLPGRGLALGEIRVVGGVLEVLTPVEGSPAPRIPVVASPDGAGPLQRLALEGLDLLLEDVQLGGPGGQLLTGRLADLSMEVHALDRPLTVSHLEGAVRFGPEGLELEGAELRLPASAFDASLSLGPRGDGEEEWGLRMELRTQGPAALSDLAWLDDRMPEGVFRGGVEVSAAGALDVTFQDMRVEVEASRLTLDGGIRVDGGAVLRDLEVQASPVALADLAPWLERELPVEGWLSGNLLLSGGLGALDAVGRVTLAPTGFGGAPTTADLRGTFHLGPDPGVTNLRAVLDPLNFELVQAFQPTVRVRGNGRAEVDASGRFADGMRFAADLRHGPEEGGSRVLVSGSTRRDGQDRWVVDVQGDLAPLSMDLLHQVAPALSVDGGITGSVRAVGPLDDLYLTGDLAVAEGTLSVEVQADLLDPGRTYRLDATAADVRLSGVVPDLPYASRWTGRLELEGRGLALDSLEAHGTVGAWGSRVGGLHVDTLYASARVSGGLLHVDTLAARLGGFEVEGSGGLGLVAGAAGEAHLAFRTDDLGGLRPLLAGDTVIARDTLSVLEAELLRFQGVDADTLPLLADVIMSGAVDGDVVLRGTLTELAFAGNLRLRDGVYGADRVGAADVRVDASDVTGPGRIVALTVDASGVSAYRRSFAEVAGDLRLEGRQGEGSVSALTDAGERYSAEGAFALDSVGSGGEVRLDQAVIEVDARSWRLVRPGLVRWDSATVTVADVEIAREGDDPMTARADGTLAWGGESDFHATVQGLHLDHLARVAQRKDLAVGGHLDLDLAVKGPAEAPAIEASFDIVEPRYGDVVLTAMAGELRYADRLAVVELTAMNGSRQVLRAAGTVPVDLALRSMARRVVQGSMDVQVEADSLAAALALSYLTFLEDVDGAVSGEFRIRGALDRPEPSGVLRLDKAAWTIEALGVRHSAVDGSLTLRPDRTVEVVVDGRAGGTSTIRGTVVLDPLGDPRLDLTVGFRGFQAVGRRDVAGVMSGEVRLLGSYRSPRVEGALSVDEGTLFLEEFIRSSEVVDLTDPRIFEVVDTTALSTRPLLAGIRNPFLQNLRVDVDLAVASNTWLRSEEMNVEIGGNLLVRYDRLTRDVVMVGELQALRGSYMVLGRRFDVEGGTVEFVGTPGINPTLNIQAVSRIRRVEGDPLDVNAAVVGTLTQPRVTLSSGEQGIAESDLVSYLIFGRPSYELATGQEAWLAGAAGSFAGAGVTYLSGTLAARLGAALSQQIGLDYLSITQGGDFGVASGSLGGSLAGTQVEVGQYLGQNVFVVLIFRPLTGQSTGQGLFGGARVEVALTDEYNVQGFWEDRFLRSRVGGFGDLGIQASQVKGVFIFREWGY
ncbi:MAG: translocation/assembly module TamB domain-containing protein [Longimicrobiales bacterium]|nr:translocation/assembly module TamB domain-containing protein [Longimicrobiales bacterium]